MLVTAMQTWRLKNPSKHHKEPSSMLSFVIPSPWPLSWQPTHGQP
jgi:hypothetical protein